LTKTKIIFNGTGSSTGVPQLFCKCSVCTSGLIENIRTRFSMTVIEKETVLQVDVPFEFRIQLLKAGIDRIDALWITHPHSDHIAGIDDIRMASFKNRAPLPVFAGAGTITYAKEKFPYMFFENEYVNTPFLKPFVLDGSPFSFKDMEIVPIKHFHGDTDVHSFRMKDFGLLADISSISENELDKLKGVKVLAVSATTKHQHIKHMSISEVLELIGKISPQRAYLTHMNHTFDYFEIKKEIPENVFPAYDGLRIEV
jgi:phosphoribosyl 1,2-cyclic phosphate phosphodiesterase